MNPDTIESSSQKIESSFYNQLANILILILLIVTISYVSLAPGVAFGVASISIPVIIFAIVRVIILLTPFIFINNTGKRWLFLLLASIPFVFFQLFFVILYGGFGSVMFWGLVILLLTLIFCNLALEMIKNNKNIKIILVILFASLAVSFYLIFSKITFINQITAIRQAEATSEGNDRNIMKNAVTPSDCEGVKNIYINSQCMISVIEKNKDFSVCGKVADWDLQKECFFEGVKQTKDISLCEKIPKLTRQFSGLSQEGTNETNERDYQNAKNYCLSLLIQR